MHERSLVKKLLQQVQQIAAAEQADVIEEIHVQIGPLAGIEPLLFETAFAELANLTLGAPCRLHLELVPLTACCADCGEQFEVINFEFRCPVCLADSVHTLQGDEVKLISITVNSEDSLDGART
ncbi:MAG: hydrogenase maturation nickel metallochaperone HypA [Planctomycetaceae bacterium]